MTTGGTALFRQTFLVLVGALCLAHLAGFIVIILLAPGDSGVTMLSGIAMQLDDPTCDNNNVVPALSRTNGLNLTKASGPPSSSPSMQSDPLLTSQLAQALGVPESSVRLAWPGGSEIRLKRPAHINIDNRQNRVQESVFLRELMFARKWPDYWCIGTVPSPDWFNHWQARTALILLLSLAVLLFPAWLFARRLSRPIGEFAAAADAIGRDHQAPLLDENGPTEMRIAARALNAMQIRIQDQMRERESMIAAIAHDLRTPLSRIAFRVEAASPSVSESVQRDIEQMNAMITTTLEYASESQQPKGNERVDLKQLLETMVEDEQAIGNSAEFSSDIGARGAIVVEGDEIQFSRLFQNLVDNANKFGGGAEIHLTANVDEAIVTVADCGPGIDPGQFGEMFRAFSRGEPSRNQNTGGMGLGLSITRAIAHKHGGDIELANRDGGGLLVKVVLPLAG